MSSVLSKLLVQRRVVLEYLRAPGDSQGRGRPLGVVVAWKGNRGQTKLGWSRCHPRDPYDREYGIKRALAQGMDVDLQISQIQHMVTGNRLAYEQLKPVINRVLTRAEQVFNPQPQPKAKAKARPRVRKPRRKTP
jgi:hypothetical protein